MAVGLRHRREAVAGGPGRGVLFGLPRLASSYVNTGLVLLVLPAVVVAHAGEHAKGLHLGAFRAVAALLCVVTLWAAGRRADRAASRAVRRLQVIGGLALALPFLAVLAAGRGYAVSLAAFLGLVLSRALVEAGHVPMLVGWVDAEGRSRASALIACYHFAGAGLGALAFALLPAAAGVSAPWLRYPEAAVGALVVALSTAGFAAGTTGCAPRGPRRAPPAVRRLVVPLKVSSPLGLLLAARVFFLAGSLVVGVFLLYIVRDVFEAADPQRATGLLYAASLVGAVAATVPSAALARRCGEVPVLLGSGAVAALAAPPFLLLGPRYPAVALASIVVFAAAFGAIVSVGLALSVRLVERPEQAGRLFALLAVSTFAADFLASATGALVLDPLNRLQPDLGYYGLLVMVEVFFVIGGVLLLRVRAADVPSRPGPAT